MTCPRCNGLFFVRRRLPGGGRADICEECGWPGPRAIAEIGIQAGKSLRIVLAIPRMPPKSAIVTASEANAAMLRRYARMFGREDIQIVAIPADRHHYTGYAATFLSYNEAEEILADDYPETMK